MVKRVWRKVVITMLTIMLFLTFVEQAIPVLPVIAQESVPSVEVSPVQVSPAQSSPGQNSAYPQTNEITLPTQQDVLNELQQDIHLDEVFDLFASYEDEVKTFLPQFSFGDFFKGLLQGRGGLESTSLLQGILSFCVKTFVVNGPLISKLIILAIFCAILNQLQLAFGGQVSHVARLLNVFVLIGLAVSAFRVALEVSNQAIDSMVAFMQAILPFMFTVLLAMGNITSTALFKPLVLGSLAVFATIMKVVVLPLFFLAVGLKLFNSISQQFKLDKLANLLETMGKIAIGLVMTVFLGVMSVQGVAGGVADGVGMRTAKYSADLVPVVGRYFKDAVELVVGSGMLLKNALGIVVIVALIFITLIPVLKIAAMALTFYLASALVEPIGEKELAGALQDMGKGLRNIFATVAAVGLMFFLTVVIVVGVGTFSALIQ
jgi:stage III sporulation protein AE